MADVGVGDLLDGIASNGFLKKIAELVGKILGALVKAFGEGFANEGAQKAFWRAIRGLVEELLDLLSDLTKNLDAFPTALGSGALDSLNRIRSLGGMLTACGQGGTIEVRVKAVDVSIKELFKLIDGGATGGGAIFGEIFGSILSVLTAAMSSTQRTEELIFDLLVKIVFPKDMILKILDSLIEKRAMGWATLPTGMLGGQLNEWLNNPDLYPRLGGATEEEQKRFRDTQREFRVRMIAVADAYLRKQLGEGRSPLSFADERISAQSIADVIIIFLENVIGFSLESKCYPQLDADWEGFEDIGFQFAAILAKQIRLMIRGTIGLVLRGAWEYSLHSDVLVEMVATIFGAIVSAFVEAYVKNLAFAFQIVSCYQGAAVAEGAVVPTKLRWKSLETVEDTGQPGDQLEYVGIIRMPCNHVPDVPDELVGVIKDFGAYIDATYRQAKVDSRFPQREVDERITVTRCELRRIPMGSGQPDRLDLTLWATTSETFELPQPVLRAYVCCEVLVMRPGLNPHDPYTVNVPLDRIPRCPDVFILSNRGGMTRRRLVIS